MCVAHVSPSVSCAILPRVSPRRTRFRSVTNRSHPPALTTNHTLPCPSPSFHARPTKARLRGKRSEWARVRSGAWCDSPLLPGTKWKRHGDTLQRDAHESQRATESSDSSEKTLQRCKRARVDTTEIRTISRGGDATLTPTLPFKPTTHIDATPADPR